MVHLQACAFALFICLSTMTALEIGETSKVPEVSKTPSGVGFVTGYATSNDVCTHPVPEADVVVPVGGPTPLTGIRLNSTLGWTL